MKAIIAKEVLGAIAAVTGGLFALFFEFYTTFGFCGLFFLWSLLSLVVCFFENHQTPSQENKPEVTSVIAETDLPEIRTENQMIALNCGVDICGEIGVLDDCGVDANSTRNPVNTVIFLKPDTNLCNN